MKARPIIFDTDPGIDDAAAIVIAVRNPQLDVKLISTVGANVEVEKTTANALHLVEFLDADIPVARGCGEPLLRKLEPCPEIHGVTGMDGYEFPPVTRKPADKHAVEAMRETIMSSEEKITLVVIGTHTNIAILLRMYPEVKEHIAEIVTMGGGLAGGNTNSSAEFNIYNDPHAAAIVFSSGIPITMLGLNVTSHVTMGGGLAGGNTNSSAEFNIYNDPHAAAIVFSSGIPITMLGLNVTSHALVRRKEAEVIGKSGRVGDMIFSLFSHYRGGTLDEGLRVHDAAAVAYLLKPQLFKTEMMSVEIATEGVASGTTVSDFRAVQRGEKTPNVKVVTEVDTEGFASWFAEEFCGREEA